MRVVVCILLLLTCNAVYASFPPLSEIRTIYYAAPNDEKAAENFYQLMNSVNLKSKPVMQGYKAMAYMLKAKHTLNPINKLAYFNKGKTLLNNAANTAPADVELRFLRFCAQTNTPSFLGYNTHIQKDKAVLLHSWATMADADLKQRIRNYLLTSEYCTELEKSILK